MGKIAVTFEDNIDPQEALSYVKKVVGQGRISNNNKQYCYLTTFESGIHVSAGISKTQDSFHVYKVPK